MRTSGLRDAFLEVETHSLEGQEIAKDLHMLYENSLRGDLTALSLLKGFEYNGNDQPLKIKVTELVLLASSVGNSQ